MTAIWQEEQVRPDAPPAAAVVPPFAAALRELVDRVDAGGVVPEHSHERRLVQRVRAALAAFEAGWTVIGESDDHSV